FDGNGNRGDAARENAFRRVFEGQRLAGGDDAIGDFVIEKIGARIAEGTINAELVAVAQKQRRPASVDQRNHPEEDLVGKRIDVQRAGDGEADVVQRLQ